MLTLTLSKFKMINTRIISYLSKPKVILQLSRPLSSVCENQKKCQEGKTALVTGASMGIGMQFVKALLEHGVMNIMLSDTDTQTAEKEISKLRRMYKSACLSFVPCNVTKSEEMENLFDRTMEMFGSIDIVCNNAGIFNEEKWNTMTDINLKGVIRGSWLALECMSKEKGGKGGTVVNVASILGLQVIAGSPVYNAAKHGVIGFTRSMGGEYHFNKTCVRFMAMCPGVTHTPLISKAFKLTKKSELSKEAARGLGALPSQHVCYTGTCLIKMLNRGVSGSCWITEGKEIYEVVLPDRFLFQRKC